VKTTGTKRLNPDLPQKGTKGEKKTFEGDGIFELGGFLRLLCFFAAIRSSLCDG
jgi:hypothetical protein